MTATRDRRSDPGSSSASAQWDERPLLGTSRGMAWWGAILLALGLTVIGAVADLQSGSTLGRIYQGAYFVGCVGAVCVVRRRNLFGPMVQPPLILGITVPAAVLVGAQHTGGDMKTKLLAVSAPLINSFPTMAVTTAVTIAIGLVRIYFVQRDPAKAKGKPRPQAKQPGNAAGRPDRNPGKAGDSPQQARGGRPRGAESRGRRGGESGTSGSRGKAPRREGGQSPRGSNPGRRQTSEPRPRREQPPRRGQPPREQRSGGQARREAPRRNGEPPRRDQPNRDQHRRDQPSRDQPSRGQSPREPPRRNQLRRDGEPPRRARPPRTGEPDPRARRRRPPDR